MAVLLMVVVNIWLCVQENKLSKIMPSSSAAQGVPLPAPAKQIIAPQPAVSSAAVSSAPVSPTPEAKEPAKAAGPPAVSVNETSGQEKAEYEGPVRGELMQ